MDVQLTPMQQRTVRSLLGDGGGVAFDPNLPERLRSRIEDGIAGAVPADGDVAPGSPAARVRLSKERLNDLDRCEGSFAAALAGERPVWAPTRDNAVGTLLHRALEADAAAAEEAEPALLVQAAVGDLGADARYSSFLAGLDPVARGLLVADAVAGVELFRASFPPLGLARRLLAPVAERWLVAAFAGGAVTLSGRVDLIVGRFDRRHATRVLVDLKTGGAWPEHAQDMRLYALLFTLRFGAPPLRVASFFLRSGECQPEDVDEDLLVRAADRVVFAVRAAGRLAPEPRSREDGPGPVLRPGPWCRWCPRRSTCPVAAAPDLGRDLGSDAR